LAPVRQFPDRKFSVSIVIPCRNERGNIESAILRIPNCTSEVWSGACHRAAQSADPLGPSRNDDVYLGGNRADN
jgi:hypothetical protein